MSLNQFALPTPTTAVEIVAGPDGNLWFTEPNVNQIGRITPDGSVAEFPVRSVAHITAGPDGNVWFSDGDFVGRITPDGTVAEFEPNVSFGAVTGIAGGPDGDVWFARQFGGIERITPDGQITRFQGLTVGEAITSGPDGNLWFTEPFSNRIGRLTPDGSTLAEFPVQGKPLGITTGPDGNVWFTDNTFEALSGRPTAGHIGRITPDGRVTEFALAVASSQPTGITAGPDGNLWFTETSAGAGIGKITPNGQVSEYAVPASGGIAAGPDRNLWVAQVGHVGQFVLDGIGGIANVFPLPTPTAAVDLTAGPDGNLWFTERDANQIGRISLNGTVTEFPAGTQFAAGPVGVTAGPDGNLWFTENAGPAGGQVGRITPDGSVTIFQLPSDFAFVAGITTGPDGNLWIGNYFGSGRITPDGQVTYVPHGAPGAITAGPDGNLWLTDPRTGFNGTAGQIIRLTPDGQETDFRLAAGTQTEGITAGPDGNLWFTENVYQISFGISRLAGARVGRITPDGSVTEFALPVPESLPTGITVGPDGNLWFTETAPGAGIGRITLDGQITEFPIPAGEGPVGDDPTRVAGGIGTGPDGNLWFVGDGKIGQFILNGAGAGMAAHSAPGARQALTAGHARVDAVFSVARAELPKPVVVGKPPTVEAVAPSRPETVLPAQPAAAAVVTRSAPHKQDRTEAADTAWLADLLGEVL